jgi:hypothetical protein
LNAGVGATRVTAASCFSVKLPSKAARHARIKFAFATELRLTGFCETNILYVELF